MQLDTTVLATILSPIIAGIITICYEKYLRNKPKLVVYYGYIAAHKMAPTERNPNELRVHTHNIVIRNGGKLPTYNVRVGHSELPDFNVIPDSKFEISDLASGGKEILFPIMVPNEEISISYLYFPPLTVQGINTYVKSDDGFAKVIRVIPGPDISGWKKYLLNVFLFLGMTTAIYLSFMIARGLFCLIRSCSSIC